MTQPPRIAITWGHKVDAASIAKLERYAAMLQEAGAHPVALIPAGCLEAAWVSHEAGALELLGADEVDLGAFDGVLLAGGADVDPSHYGQTPGTPTLSIDPDRDAFELPLARQALSGGLPVLGICRGFQVVNVALGGTLYQDIPTAHPDAVEHRDGAHHEIRLLAGSRIAELAGVDRLVINSYHHQGIELPNGLAPALTATAWAPDGVVEAVEPRAGALPGYLMAVQWHPEKLVANDDPVFASVSRAIFADFIAGVLEHRQAAGSPKATA